MFIRTEQGDNLNL